MRMLFKQRMFSWFDSYDIYDEQGNVLFIVKGQFSWGHCLHILTPEGVHIATVKQVIWTFLPRFELYLGDDMIGELKKELTFFRPMYNVEALGWNAEGDFFEWDYSVIDRQGELVAQIRKQLFNWTDTYIIDVQDEADALGVLMFVLAVDAEKCSRSND